MTTGKKIKMYRNLKNLTQKELGVLVGLSDDRIRQYEANIRTPKESMLDDFAKALDVPIEFLRDRKLDSEYDVLAVLEEIKICFGVEIINDFLKKDDIGGGLIVSVSKKKKI